jgi:hypothetical protein
MIENKVEKIKQNKFDIKIPRDIRFASVQF